MRYEKKSRYSGVILSRLYCSIILLMLLISIVSSAQVVQVQDQPPAEKKSFMSKTFGFLKSPIFWFIILGFVIFIVILLCIFFLIRWLVKFLKARNNIFFNLRSQRVKLSKIHKRYASSTHFLKVEKNTPIRLVKQNNGRVFVTEPIAYYRGDYVSHEGNVIISMNMRYNKKWFFLPITDILIIPNKERIEINQKDTKSGKVIKMEINNLPMAKDIVQFNEDEVLIYADSFSNIGSEGNEFYVPVLKAKDGKILDLSMPLFQSLKEVVLGDYLFEQTDDFSKLAKKSMDINPNIRAEMKVKDASQSVEIPQNR
jgi:hypothetical protein